MKAVILAGGEGTRLLPITEKMPKPLVPILGTPVLFHIFRLLREAGIHEAILTLKYRAGDIIERCKAVDTKGIKLTFLTEETPLGTAGCIGAAEALLPSDFLVISGDAMCDLSLADAISFHRERGALATLVTARQKDPTDFGGVVADGGGKILRFAEKPPWQGVLTDRINTGIYVFSRGIFDYIPKGGFCDFAKDVFPALMGKGLYAFPMEGYWCDIGSLDAYYACNRDAAAGRIRGISPSTGHFIARNAEVDVTAVLGGCCIIGQARVGRNVRLSDAVLMDGVTVGAGARIDRSVLSENVFAGENAVIPLGCVIGAGAVIEKGTVLPSGARIGGDTIIRTEDMILKDRIFQGAESDVFRAFGLAGSVKREMTPAFLLRCGAAFFQVFGGQGIFFDDGTASADHVKHLLLCGAMSAGVRAVDGGEGFSSLAAFSTVKSGSDFGVFVKREENDIHTISLFDSAGLAVGTAATRRLSAAMRGEYETVLPSEKAREDDYYGEYIHFLVDNGSPLSEKLILAEGAAGEAAYAAASLLGAYCEMGTKSGAADGYIFVHAGDEGKLDVTYRSADGTYVMIDRWHATAALIRRKLQNGETVIPLSASAPNALMKMVSDMGGTVHLLDEAGQEARPHGEEALSFLWQSDMVLLALLFIAELGVSREAPVTDSDFATAEKTLSVESAAQVLGVLSAHGAEVENGKVLLRFGDASVRVTARDSGTVGLFAEGASPHEAEDALRYAEKGILESVPQS